MSKKTTDTTATGGTAVILQGDAFATGGATLTKVTGELSLSASTSGTPKVKGSGEITAVAVAEPTGDGTAGAFTTAYSTGADKVKITTIEATFQDGGVHYSYSSSSIKVKDGIGRSEPNFSYHEKSKELRDAPLSIDGNLALAEFAVTAEGSASVAVVAADVLVVEDMLSTSFVNTVAAVDWAL